MIKEVLAEMGTGIIHVGEVEYPVEDPQGKKTDEHRVKEAFYFSWCEIHQDKGKTDRKEQICQFFLFIHKSQDNPDVFCRVLKGAPFQTKDHKMIDNQQQNQSADGK